MEQHPIPRQITSFEFKLIGFMTLKQFLYIVIFAPIGYIAYVLFPIPILNIIIGFAVGSIGVALAFIPINDRPLDVWIRNFWKRINSPTQYFFHKNNPPISIFQNLYFVEDPHRVMAHIQSQQMLSKYLAETKQTMTANIKKQQVQQTVSSTTASLRGVLPGKNTIQKSTHKPSISSSVISGPSQQTEKKPFFIGEIKNNKHISLPGILIYVKDLQGKPVRLLKSNPHGIFATYNPLPNGEYIFEMKDPKNIYFFDTMKVHITEHNNNIEIISKEML